MNLLKYVEPMKNLPDRFSNLAFWRGCRKFKDSVVNALEYIDSWGGNIENTVDGHTHDIADLVGKVEGAKNYDFVTLQDFNNTTFKTTQTGANLFALVISDGSTVNFTANIGRDFRDIVPLCASIDIPTIGRFPINFHVVNADHVNNTVMFASDRFDGKQPFTTYVADPHYVSTGESHIICVCALIV